MKSPNQDDPLLEALAGDEQGLSQAVAAEVRSRRRRRRRLNNILGAATIGVMLATCGLWLSKAFTNHGHSGAIQVTKNENSALPRSALFGDSFVKVYPADSAIEEDLASPAATEKERKLLDDLRDAPSLVVWNDAGQISRVHVFEKSQ